MIILFAICACIVCRNIWLLCQITLHSFFVFITCTCDDCMCGDPVLLCNRFASHFTDTLLCIHREEGLINFLLVLLIANYCNICIILVMLYTILSLCFTVFSLCKGCSRWICFINSNKPRRHRWNVKGVDTTQCYTTTLTLEVIDHLCNMKVLSALSKESSKTFYRWWNVLAHSKAKQNSILICKQRCWMGSKSSSLLDLLLLLNSSVQLFIGSFLLCNFG